MLLLVLATARAEHILFNLPRGATQCFTATTTANSAILGEIRVLNGDGDLPVGFWLLVGATNEILRTTQNVDHDKFSVLAPRGPHHGHDESSAPAEYRLCVFQRASLGHGSANAFRKVYLSFGAEGDQDAFDEREAARDVFAGKATQTDMDDMRGIVDRAERALNGIRNEIDGIRGREQAMFSVANRAARQIWVMGVVTCIAVVAGGLLQLQQTQQELHLHGKRVLGVEPSLSRQGRYKPAQSVAFGKAKPFNAMR